MRALGDHIFAGAFDFCPFTSPAGIHIKYFKSVGHLGEHLDSATTSNTSGLSTWASAFVSLDSKLTQKHQDWLELITKPIQEFLYLVRGLNTLIALTHPYSDSQWPTCAQTHNVLIMLRLILAEFCSDSCWPSYAQIHVDPAMLGLILIWLCSDSY